MTTTTENALNQVDIAAVATLVQTIQNRPEAAQTTWAASVSWNGAFASEARVRDFDPIASDEPSGLGGGDTAPNPVEQLLGALGNCLAVGYAANATLAGIVIRDLRIDLDGDLDLHTFLGLADGHAGFSAIRAAVHLDTDADAEAIAELHRKVAATSPVGHTLRSAIPVQITPA
ncbi:OsmC family protein [Paractinoplanes toevensis]|uniref:Osmotically inducible protein C n=1 Tax=Paractinoplanes toevensis TaxID=571911 RepID=A0A919T5F0_9ACTN|nr:OsmC family protein [Actinoplanes toevensis]GIM89694.1 osmotically inducible protein C [Actinoplanes toevensis]